ncbi:MAG: hypothetical protein KBT04_02945 [Bacteroidales bacterium]|nr:hypothetical protein [Candidatus Colimorpha onthohippi]
MKKSVVFVAAMLVLTISVYAKRDGSYLRKHEIAPYFSQAGIGSVPFHGRYDWSNPAGVNFGFGVGYTYWFNEHIGLTSGLNFDYMSHHEQLDNVSSSAYGTDYIYNSGTSMLVDMYYEVVTDKVKEQQAVTMLEIPVQLSLKAKHLYGNFGVAFATPIYTYGTYTYGESEFRATRIVKTGGSTFDIPVDVNMVDRSTGKYEYGDVKTPFYCVLMIDGGWRFEFDKCNALSLGLYLKYALNECRVDDSNFQVVDVEGGVSTSNPPIKAGLVDSYRFYTAGFRITYHIGIGSKGL